MKLLAFGLPIFWYMIIYFYLISAYVLKCVIYFQNTNQHKYSNSIDYLNGIPIVTEAF